MATKLDWLDVCGGTNERLRADDLLPCWRLGLKSGFGIACDVKFETAVFEGLEGKT